MKEKSLAKLYREFLNTMAKDEESFKVLIPMVMQMFQNFLFTAAKESGYDMKLLKKELDLIVKDDFKKDMEAMQEEIEEQMVGGEACVKS